MPARSDRPHSEAKRIYSEALSDLGDEERLDIEELCQAHPPFTEDLHELHATFESVVDRLGISGSLSERIKAKYGDDVDPGVSIDHEAQEPGSEFSSEVLRRLGERHGAFGRYKIHGEVARGGQGAVLRVWDEDLRRNLAMKVLLGKAELAELGKMPEVDSRTLSRFLEEAQVTGQLDHPGIVPVHELGLDSEGRIYFTMKLVKGRTLRETFDLVHNGEERWTVTRALGVMLKVCEAMSYAHSKGVIHRDLKPGNIMVGRFGEVYVMDWGLARVLDEEDRKDLRIQPELPTTSFQSERRDRADETPDSPLVTMDGDVVGTPAYMSPEQARGELDQLGPQSDVYAVGAMLYHLLSGQMPYVPSGARPSSHTILAMLLNGPPQAVHELASDVAPELEAICERAMARKPEDRYGNMQELSADLRAFLEGRVVSAHSTGAFVKLSKWVSRNPAKAVAAGIGAAALVVIAGMTWRIVRDNQRLAETIHLFTANEYDTLVKRAEDLPLPTPQGIPDYEDWIEDAEELLGALPEFRSTRERIRLAALPQTPEQRELDRLNHPQFGELQALRAELDLRQLALAVRRGQKEPVVPPVDWSRYPTDSRALYLVAWPMVAPDRESFGQELLGQALARKARGIGSPLEQATAGNTLAWALFAVGLDEEALDASDEAVNTAPEADRDVFGEDLVKLEAAIEAAGGEQGLAREAAELEQLDREYAILEKRVGERLTWTFPEGESRSAWLDRQLTKVIQDLESLTEPEHGLFAEDAVSEEFGWSVARRLAFAKRLEDGFAEQGEFAERWRECLPRIHAAYPELVLSEQMGLVPLGTDPESALWEFWHVQSGAEPQRDEEGELSLTEDSGLVFVLLPGGPFDFGRQGTDPTQPNYDPCPVGGESPVKKIVLSPFFLSKYEMTQAQWLRLSGSNPSRNDPKSDVPGPRIDLTHPVELVSWIDCRDLLEGIGLRLPSEAEWEYAARGGTDTPWWTGRTRESLREKGAANLADLAARRAGAPWREIASWPGFDDGFPVHAPVDWFSANPFGLHGIHGNVCEWCLDAYRNDSHYSASNLDPVIPDDGSHVHVLRGGSFRHTADHARCAARFGSPALAVDETLGLRPARRVEPPDPREP